MYIFRKIQNKIQKVLTSKKSILLLGPRQTGKTTVLQQLQTDITITLIKPRERLFYEKDPQSLEDEIMAYIQTTPIIKNKYNTIPLVVIDEIQRVPKLLDIIQFLIDNNIAQFILTGSSARSLKRQSEVNLLPGRVILLKMDPLSINELKTPNLDSLLFEGSLPGIITEPSKTIRQSLLNTYVTTYLEEEVRTEAKVRNVGNFAHFLELAALASGNTINYSKLAQNLGLHAKTIKSYFEILEDCLIAKRVNPLLRSNTRKKLSKSPKFLIFDMGVRCLASLEGKTTYPERLGQLFEHFIGLQLLSLIEQKNLTIKLNYWRDLDGPEVDWVLIDKNIYTPIEVKWTETPTQKDIRHLNTFIKEYDAKKGYLICRTPRAKQLTKQITAIPWKDLASLV